MSDASEVKRFPVPENLLDASSWKYSDGGDVPVLMCISASDHDRIVAELKAEVDELRKSECLPFDAYYKTCEVNNGLLEKELKEARTTIATQSREAEVLKVIANEAEAWRNACAAQVVNQDEVNGHRQKMFLALNKYFYPELAAIEKGEET